MIAPDMPSVALAPKRHRAWMNTYRDRIAAGQETCRECGTGLGLELARIKFHRSWSMGNTTILCGWCADDYYAEYRPYLRKPVLAARRLRIQSLYLEELARPVDARWGLAALDDARGAA